MKLPEKNTPAADSTVCFQKLEFLEKKIKIMIESMSELKAENETLKAELKYHENTAGKSKQQTFDGDDFLKHKKKIRDLLDNLLNKFSNTGI